jgi:putative redox protein
MPIEVKTKVVLQDKMVFKGKGHTGHEVQIDYLPPLGGDDGLTPTELLLISLAGCSAQTVLALLRKMGKTVEAMEVQAAGSRQDEHPTVFTGIELNFILKGDDLDAPSVERAIQRAEEKYCPVWAMLKKSIPISWKHSVI